MQMLISPFLFDIYEVLNQPFFMFTCIKLQVNESGWSKVIQTVSVFAQKKRDKNFLSIIFVTAFCTVQG